MNPKMEKTKESLLENVIIEKTCEKDFEQICELISNEFNLSGPDEARFQLLSSHVLIDESVKLCDKDTGEIYGILMFCDFPIGIGSPIQVVKPYIHDFLKQFKQVNGHSFIIDKKLRGTNLDKQMLDHNLDYLTEHYDFIWCGVGKDLKTHDYWKRMGFVETLTIDEATFYVLPLNPKMVE